jgi:hypothetical protein
MRAIVTFRRPVMSIDEMFHALDADSGVEKLLLALVTLGALLGVGLSLLVDL